MDNPDERRFYEIEAAENGWDLDELKRQFNSSLYERLALSRDKKGVLELSKRGQIVRKPEDVVKDPYVLEFLGLEEKARYSETELESRIIEHVEQFILEMGKGFILVGRQVRFTFEEKHFRVDLVFYNRILRSFVVVDLKTGELTHQDIGQMQMYVNYYDRMVKLPEENPTIGILLCADKNDAIVEMTLPQGSKRIFASKYMTVLPDKETLRLLVRKQLGGEK
jgi:predicted nuclease of restriction endonuclease-like (RecB) superfamily